MTVEHLPRSAARQVSDVFYALMSDLVHNMKGARPVFHKELAPFLVVPSLLLQKGLASSEVRRRCVLVEAQRWGELVACFEAQEVANAKDVDKARAQQASDAMALKTARLRRAERRLRQGDLRGGLRELRKVDAAAGSSLPAAVESVRPKFPPGAVELPRTIVELPPLPINGRSDLRRGMEGRNGPQAFVQRVQSAVLRAGKLKAPGPSGLRLEHVKEAFGANHALAGLANLVDLLLMGRVPLGMGDARLFCIPKVGESGFRPAGGGEVLRRVACSIENEQAKSDLVK